MPASTSVRAGFGMFYTAFEGLSAGIMSANPPYGYDYTSLAPPLFNTPLSAPTADRTSASVFPRQFLRSELRVSNPDNSVDWSQYSPITGVPSFYYSNVPPYTESYNLSIERQIAANRS